MFKHWQSILFGLVVGLLMGGVILLVGRPPAGVPVQLVPPPTIAPTATPLPLRVHVTGEVNAPGIYALPPGAIVSDALAAAGGLTSNADPTGLNLAGLLADGMQVFVGSQGSGTGIVTTEALPSGVSSGASEASSGDRVNINMATQAELETLPGIGPALAGRIIEYRDQNGLFSAPEDLMDVSGIGEVTFEDISDLITAGA